jgi:hypothetical protein
MLKTLIWTGVAGAAAAICYMFWSKRGMRLEAKGRLGHVRVQAGAARRRKPAMARG